ncbi:unnamed protein product [Ilex paraguariensis]|uniref:RNA polymerase sigma-70 region 2 domain-containing protein n=1 Tax=Ilex paraguariensis TaxID=185542 RepID=A0ABC8R4B7_9AQUA
MGFRLNLKWGFSVQSPSFTNSSPWPSSYSCWGPFCDSARASFPPVISGDSETLYNDPLQAHACSSASQTLSNDYSEMEEIKMNVGKRSRRCLYNMVENNIQAPNAEDKLVLITNLQTSKASHFSLLMENLVMLEETFADSDVVRLERDILGQLERLGALKLFHTCLSKALNYPTLFDLSDVPPVLSEEHRMNNALDKHMTEIVVRSGKKGKRKLRRERTSKKAKNVCSLPLPSKYNRKDPQQFNFSSVRRSANSRNRRLRVAKNVAEMSRGVKLVANLERIREIVEEETGQIASLSNWAEAAGVDKKVLQEHLHFGWDCRDELLRSTRSLVIYLARNYRGLGVAFEDIIQAGNFGVLQGAERFDHTRGYKFSTYVQYWIRKSMSTLMAQHARGIRIPVTLSKAINQIQKARKMLSNIHGKCPDDDEIEKFTGLSFAKITSASKCLRVVGSVDRKVGDCTSAKFLV